MRSLIRNLAAIVAGAALVLGAAFGLRTWMSPFRVLGNNSLLLYVGNCHFSQRSFRNLASSALANEDLVVPVPTIDVSRNPAMAAVCDVAVAALRRRSKVFFVLPSNLACRWLESDAAAFQRRHYMALPAFSIAGVPVPQPAEAHILHALGLERSYDNEGGIVLTRRPATTPDPSASPPINQTFGS